jgi:hypothetical protein
VAEQKDAKLAEELKKLTQQRLELEKQIVDEKLKMDSAEKKSIENIKKLVTLDALRMDSVEKEEEVRKKIEKIEKDTENRNKKSEKFQKETIERTKDGLSKEEKKEKLDKKRSDLAEDVLDLAIQQRDVSVDVGAQIGVMNDKSKKYVQNLTEGNKVNVEASNYWNRISDSIKDSYNTSDSFTGTLSEMRNINNDISDLFQESVSQTGLISKGQAKIVETDKARQALAVKKYEVENNLLGLNAADQQVMLKGIKLEEEKLAAIEAQNKVIEKQTAKVQIMQGVGSKLGTSMTGWVKNLPGGEQITKILGIDKTADNMNKSFTNAIQSGIKGNFKDAFKEGAKGLGSLIAMAPKLVAGMGLGALTGGFGLLAGGLKKVGSLLLEADAAIAQMGKDFALSKKEAGELYKLTSKMSNEMKITGINSKEIAAGISIASEAFNGVDVASQIMSGNKEMQNFVKQASVLSTQFGLSGQEIANIKDIATITGTSMDKLVKETVDMGKGVMNAKESMKVLAGIPKEVAIGFKGTSRELVAAAQKAKLLGTDLKKIKDIGRGMLDLESSLTAEFEAQAITGRNMNLDTARRLAMNGDIFNLQEELLDKAGSLEEFQNMNVIQQEAFAKAMGMSVEEMTEMLTNAQKLKDAEIDADYAEKLGNMKTAAELEKEMANAKNQGQKDYIQQLAMEKRSASLKEAMTDAIEKLKQKFAPVIDAIVQMVSGLEEGGDKVSIFQKMLDGIDMNAIAAGIKEALPKVMAAVQGLIKNLPQIIEMISGLISKFSTIAGVAGSAFSFLGPTTAGIGILALKIVGPGGIAAGFSLAGKAAGGLFNVVKGPLMAGVKGLAGSVAENLGGAFSGVAGKAGKLKDTITGAGKAAKAASAAGKAASVASSAAGAIPAGPPGGGLGGFMSTINPVAMMQGAAAILILAAALFVVAKALQEFMKVDWAAIPKAGVALLGLAGVAYLMSKASADMIIGAAAMLVLGAALYVIGAGLQFFTSISWEDLAKAGVALVAFSAIAVGLGMAAPFIAVGAAAMVLLGAGAFAFGAGMNEIVRAITELSKLGDLTQVGENLGKGMESLGSVADKIDLSKLEDAFDDLDDALEELDFEQLAAFGQLGNATLGQAGANLVAGMNSLIGINKDIDFGAIEDTFDLFEDALAELDLEGIQAFAKLGEEGIKKAGENLLVGLNSFQNIDPKTVIAQVAPLESVFDALDDAFEELDYEDLEAFGKIDFSKIGANTAGVAQFAQALGNLSNVSGIDKLEEQFAKLSDAIDDLDIEKLNELSNIKPEAMGNLGKLQAVFQPSQKVEEPAGAAGGGTGLAGAGGAAGGGAAGGGNSMGGVEAKLDQLIGLFSAIANQPTVIKFGDKTVEEIRKSINIKKTYNVEDSFGRTA